MSMQRSVLKFHNAIKSPETKKLYDFHLNKFLEYCKIKEPDGLLQLDDKALQEVLEDYLMYQKKRISPNSIPPVFSAIELFFVMNDKILNFKKLKKMYPEKIKKSGKDYWKTEDIQLMLKDIKVRRTRAIIHVLASTGCRIGALSDLKMSNLQDREGNCRQITFYEGSKEEYVGFLTPEANQSLEEYFDERRKTREEFTPNTPVFRNRYFGKARPLKMHSIKNHLYRLIDGITTRTKVGNRYNIQAEHGFRKRFATLLKDNDNANISLIEKLLGHSGAVVLDGSYHNPKSDVLFAEFKKHILNLTIDKSEKLKIQNEEKDKTIKNMESEKDSMLKDYGERLSNSEKIIQELAKRLDSQGF